MSVSLQGSQKGIPWRLEGVEAVLRATHGAGDGGPVAPGPATRPSWPSAKASRRGRKARLARGPEVCQAGVASLGLGALLQSPGGSPLPVSVRAVSWGTFKFQTPEPDHPSQPAWSQSRATKRGFPFFSLVWSAYLLHYFFPLKLITFLKTQLNLVFPRKHL